jgi:hypothetical protein
VHIAVKLPVIRVALTHDVDDDAAFADLVAADPEAPMPAEVSPPSVAQPSEGGLSRRGLLRTTWIATAVAVLGTAGATLPWLHKVSLFAIRDGDGPQGVPVNRSAAEAGVEESVVGDDYRLELVLGDHSVQLSRDELAAMDQTTVSLPIACVEGWSAMAVWRGVRLRDLLAAVKAPTGSDVYLQSLQQRGAFGTSVLPSQFVDDDLTLVALEVNGQTLDLDHGYPCRLIAPNRPGVRQTKWLSRIEVLA